MDSTRLPRVLGVMSLALSASVSGQQTVFKSNCTTVGSSPPEQLAGRQGQAISVGTYTCLIVGGPFDGAVATGTSIWHYDKGVGTTLHGAGVTRGRDAQAVWDTSEATMNLHTTEGRVTGYSGSGKGTYKLATGAAAALNGKPYTYTFRSTGPGRFEVDNVIETADSPSAQK